MAPVDRATRQDVWRPALPYETGGSIFGQVGPGAVRAAQHPNRAHERGAGGHSLELERVQEGGRPATDPGIVLAELLERVELLRTRQRLGLRDRAAEPLPRDHGGNRAVGVLLARP